MNRDPYYSRKEVSNSDLTALKEALSPFPVRGDREAAFRMGSVVDALVTDPLRLDRYRMELDGEAISPGEYRLGLEMERALRKSANSDPFLAAVLKRAATQKVSVREGQEMEYCGLRFSLDTRCKWDWWLDGMGFGGDLKTTSAATQAEFENAVDVFDWDRSRAWYMDVAGSDRDFIYAVSKKTLKVFRKFITRGDETYCRGLEKYSALAFRWWCLCTGTAEQEGVW